MRYRLVTLMSLWLAPSFALANNNVSLQHTDNGVDPKVNDAQYQCMESISKTLEQPKLAEFGFFGNYPAQKMQDGLWKVTATYDYQNRKQEQECTLRDKGAEGFELVTLAPASSVKK